MKLTGAKATSFFLTPDTSCAGLLIYGADAEKVALRSKETAVAWVGETAKDEMRLMKLIAADVRKDPALLYDTVKAQGFFPGPRAVIFDGATDTLVDGIENILQDWQKGDAYLIITAGLLNTRSKLRKLFENSVHFYAVGVYDNPLQPEDIDKACVDAGFMDVVPEAKMCLLSLSQDIGASGLRQILEKLSLYKLGDKTPLSIADIEACMPATLGAELSDLLHITAEARSNEVGPVLARLSAQGINATTLCIGAARHFRLLHAAACDPQGLEAGFRKARPPVFGARKDQLVRQARTWGVARLEKALDMLMETDLMLRSSRPVPGMALVERTFIRLAMMCPK